MLLLVKEKNSNTILYPTNLYPLEFQKRSQISQDPRNPQISGGAALHVIVFFKFIVALFSFQISICNYVHVKKKVSVNFYLTILIFWILLTYNDNGHLRHRLIISDVNDLRRH